jgi:hypothetical protein
LLTVLVGGVIFLLRERLVSPWPALNLATWYAGALFLTIDPIYLGLLSWFMQGSDANAMEIVGWPVWPLRVVAMALAGLGGWLVLRWRSEARQQLERYSLRG